MDPEPEEVRPVVFNFKDAPLITVGGTHNNMLSHVCIGSKIPTEGLHIDVHRYPEGGFSNVNVHDRSEQAYLILEGEGEVKVGGETMPVKPGSLIFIPRRYFHCIRNTGQGELILLFISCQLGEEGSH